MKLSRRQAVKVIALQIIASSCSLLKSKKKIDEFYLSSSSENLKKYSISISNLSQKSIKKESVLERPHSILDTKNYLIFIPKVGSQLITFNKASHIIKEINAPVGFLFYGHGVSSGNQVYLSLASKVTKGHQSYDSKGYIAEFFLNDGIAFKIHPSGGKDPHQMEISKDGEFLYICNGGGRTNLVKMNRKTKKILEINELSLEFKDLSLRHLCISKDKIYLGTKCNYMNSIPSYLFVYQNNKIGRVLLPAEAEKKMRLQLLSIIEHDGYVYITCPATSTIFVYNSKKNIMVAMFNHIKATSLSYSKTFKGVLVGSASHQEPISVIVNNNNNFLLKKLNFGEDLIGEHSLITYIEKAI